MGYSAFDADEVGARRDARVAAVVHQRILNLWDKEALDKVEDDVHEVGEVHSLPFQEEA